jgi:hypothetical protein
MIISDAHFSELTDGENAVPCMLFRFARVGKRKFACERRECKQRVLAATPGAGSLHIGSLAPKCSAAAEAQILLYFFSLERGSRSQMKAPVFPSGTISP